MTEFLIKCSSGRFIFTVITALVFAWSAYTKVLSNEQIVSIIMLIVSFYFTKNRQEGGGK